MLTRRLLAFSRNNLICIWVGTVIFCKYYAISALFPAGCCYGCFAFLVNIQNAGRSIHPEWDCSRFLSIRWSVVAAFHPPYFEKNLFRAFDALQILCVCLFRLPHKICMHSWHNVHTVPFRQRPASSAERSGRRKLNTVHYAIIPIFSLFHILSAFDCTDLLFYGFLKRFCVLSFHILCGPSRSVRSAHIISEMFHFQQFCS